MIPLYTTTLPRTYVLAGGEEVDVPPATVEQAVQLLEVLEAMEDDADEALFWQVAGGWLPEVVAEDLRGRSEAAFSKRLRSLIYQGAQRPGRGDDGGAGGEMPTWRYLVSTFCATYPDSTLQVWREMPFPYFLALVNEAPVQRTREMIDRGTAAGLPHADEKTWKNLQRRARKGRSRPQKQSDKEEAGDADSLRKALDDLNS